MEVSFAMQKEKGKELMNTLIQLHNQLRASIDDCRYCGAVVESQK